MISCKELMENLYDFMDKEINRSLYHEIKGHLENCSICGQRYEFENNIRTIVKAHCVNITAPQSLRTRIIHGLDSADAEYQNKKESISERKLFRTPFSSVSYTIAASVLLLISGSILYYTYFHSSNVPAVSTVVDNHIEAIENDNLVFNEKTSVVNNIDKYLKNNVLENNINMRLQEMSPLFVEQTHVIESPAAGFPGTNSSCVIFNKGRNKLSLQIVPNNLRTQIRNFERTLLGTREFYIGSHHGFNSVIWEENGSTYCLTSDMNKSELLHFAAKLTSR